MNQSGIDLNQEKNNPFTIFSIHFPLLDNFSKRGKEKVIQNGQLSFKYRFTRSRPFVLIIIWNSAEPISRYLGGYFSVGEW